MNKKIEGTIVYPRSYISFIINQLFSVVFGVCLFILGIYISNNEEPDVGTIVGISLTVGGIYFLILFSFYQNLKITLQTDSFTYQQRKHLWKNVKCVYFNHQNGNKCILIGLKGSEYPNGIFLEVINAFSAEEGIELYDIFRAYAPEDPSLLKLQQKINNNCYQ